MNTLKTKSIFIMSVVLAFVLLSSCDEPVESQFVVKLKNSSSEEIHLWTSSESIDPSNKLAPGQSRTTMYPWKQEDGSEIVEWINITVSAGKSGQTLTSKTFKVVFAEKKSLSVVYSGGALSETN